MAFRDHLETSRRCFTLKFKLFWTPTFEASSNPTKKEQSRSRSYNGRRAHTYRVTNIFPMNVVSKMLETSTQNLYTPEHPDQVEFQTSPLTGCKHHFSNLRSDASIRYPQRKLYMFVMNMEVEEHWCSAVIDI
ncbi:hypothetical protein PsorP6_009105 [Peronosclerospora sorghi]|uniref:Uncharacterized protein n=1 Tax=Peronosclerospora sorghi TaxID=230839 RepID=A0ACC0W038_9STRA|nr:hypothetical protein PsorP6_009105 [Peronosclerospora sorghi]